MPAGFRFPPLGPAAVALSLAFAAPGAVHAGSNLDQGAYPDPQCGERPVPPERPERFRFRAELDQYNARVAAFNAAEERYVRCLQAYIDNAADDIKLIRRKIELAVESGKR
ncbi:MAG: hypothetical protein R3174_12010 [Gammaproteobacteria bacterium]|nr:hypothetical protein [Gammaproteobacteria bacterium]